MKGINQSSIFRRLLVVTTVSFLIGGCLTSGEQTVENDPQESGGNPNSAPVISGSAPLELTAGETYSFTPKVVDANNDTLSFTIDRLPSWASFNNSTGQVSGTPQSDHVGTYSGITITVSDGQAEDTLGPFTITVQAVSLGSVTLSWTAPTQNEDGSTLEDLDGYNIYWGTQPGNYPNSVTIDNESVTTYVVENLSPGSYEFVATSFNTSGVESRYSNPAIKVVN